MADEPDRPSGSGAPATLGRLGGLTALEAERGEKALWLTGGGYRAALFHLGALTRLNELGLLAGLATVGAVSGGSILAALLAARVEWPLHGAYREWPERVAEPLREIARRNARARALLRRPFRTGDAEAALEERYARQLVASLGGESRWGPRFVFGASGLTLSGLAADWEESLDWELAEATPAGYEPGLVAATIAAVRTDLDAFAEAEQAVLENHGYLLADAALRERGLAVVGGIATGPPEPPHPRWMDAERVREALRASGRRTALGRLRPRRPRGSSRSLEGTTPAHTELLERFRPLLNYDSLEGCRADSVELICGVAERARCNSLHRADGSLIAAAAPPPGRPRLDLDFLRWPAYPNGEAAREDDYLDESGGSPVADALRVRRREGCADVVYGRARHDREGRLWLQYWFFHYYDDRGWLGLQQREGDWEMVQLRLGADGTPDAVTLARHADAERLRWEDMELARIGDCVAPVIYPARGSHAPLPRPGSYAAPLLPDHCDGRGARVRPRLEPIGDDGPGWVLWRGRWGSTRRREYFEADSPRGPRAQPQWWDPLELHEGARPAGEAEAAPERSAESPPPARLEARREGELAIVSYRFEPPAADGAQPARIVAAPIDDGAEPCEPHCLAIDGLEGSLALPLRGGRAWRGVRAAAASVAGLSGETLAARFDRFDPAGSGEERAG